jgi:hypothetical protein
MFNGISVCKKINDKNRMADEILPHTRRAFCTMGHGCDVIPDQIPGQPEVKLPEYRVPAGCTFVTVEVCGRYSSTVEVSKIFEAFQDPLLKEALKYPDNDTIWRVLHDYLQIEADENSVLRVRTEGQLFTNPFIYLWSNFDKNSYYSTWNLWYFLPHYKKQYMKV